MCRRRLTAPHPPLAPQAREPARGQGVRHRARPARGRLAPRRRPRGHHRRRHARHERLPRLLRHLPVRAASSALARPLSLPPAFSLPAPREVSELSRVLKCGTLPVLRAQPEPPPGQPDPGAARLLRQPHVRADGHGRVREGGDARTPGRRGVCFGAGSQSARVGMVLRRWHHTLWSDGNSADSITTTGYTN